ncbi:histidinol phosphate phosphatase [Brumimicrobium salinarum]|uniref:Histidinol phosphate phosphatase n=1 Tax=Brumimicrobium salinarum TaxID=2058658 RepID=A0A2I0R4T8_9FLAO|nr:HAD-IIIA family hydrolase [Brumimicrobium salinarum]PKR81604.1 histidinol phosphate phosphatase [Brumimicrobium salinarum]
MEAIILAGGLGTRLQHISKHTPKSMALIKGRPFLAYQLDALIAQGVNRFILSIGYKSEQIRAYFKNEYRKCEIIYAVEEELLGTGGAIINAMQLSTSQHVVVANGDSLVVNNLKEQYAFHIKNSANVTLALKEMKNFERYGTVDLDEFNQILHFNEKKPVKEGLINVGVYIFDKEKILDQTWPKKFSIERDFFEDKVSEFKLYGWETTGYFLDIGIPIDFEKAQTEIGTFMHIDSSWTLFLDRDGVINKKRDNDYVKCLDELILFPSALEAIADLTPLFDKIVIVTNQQGIGKGLMTETDLKSVHEEVLKEVERYGGHIDKIYFAPQLAKEQSKMRKPEIGMAIQAKKDFPSIEFDKSIMVGDSISDMQFGDKAGMTNVYIHPVKHDEYYTVDSLATFSKTISSLKQN